MVLVRLYPFNSGPPLRALALRREVGVLRRGLGTFGAVPADIEYVSLVSSGFNIDVTISSTRPSKKRLMSLWCGCRTQFFGSRTYLLLFSLIPNSIFSATIGRSDKSNDQTCCLGLILIPEELRIE